MCIIAISPKGKPQPSYETMKEMFLNNPHGSGYMFVNDDGNVEIHKGFMSFDDFYRSVKAEKFTEDDVVVYHFRISTQAGVNPQMCHPFPLSSNPTHMKKLDLVCSVGIAHNGIIPITSNKNKEFSDTALFITEYMSKMIKCRADLNDERLLRRIEGLIQSKMAILEKDGTVTLIGKFITEDDGNIYSNTSYKPKDFTYYDVNLFDRTTWHYPKNYKAACK